MGKALRPVLPQARFLGRDELDVTDDDAVFKVMRGARVIVHLAAFTNVDGCEAQPDKARRINHIGTRNIADAAMDHNVRVIYLSTDYVFDGTKETEYEEEDLTGPLNVYGSTKLSGEQEVARVPDRWIVRSSWIFGEGPNFIRTILARAREGVALRIVEDQVGRPSSALSVASAIAALVDEEGQDIVHVAGDGEPCSWADLAGFALGSAGITASVDRITTETYRRESPTIVARRPMHSVLSIEKARSLGLPLLDWRDSVRREIGAIG